MKTASALHILALGACFVVQFGAPDVSTMPGVRRAIQTMEIARSPSSQADEAAVVRFPLPSVGHPAFLILQIAARLGQD